MSVFNLCRAIGLLVLSVACGAGAVAQEKDADATDTFVLRQLIEMQNDLKRLTSQVVELRLALDKLATAPAAPAAPAGVAAPAQPVEPTIPAEVALEADDPMLGSTAATVAIVEFSDFQCPFCSRFHQQTFPELKKQYIDTGKVKYAIRDYPLGFHAEARPAAIAANCAAKQVDFWTAKQQLYAQQAALGEPLYLSLTDKLALDAAAYAQCRKDTAAGSEVDADFNYGQSIGVSGTPTFFVGRIEGDKLVDVTRIVGAQPLAPFAQAIDALL